MTVGVPVTAGVAVTIRVLVPTLRRIARLPGEFRWRRRVRDLDVPCLAPLCLRRRHDLCDRHIHASGAHSGQAGDLCRDVIANLGVIAAGVLVAFAGSEYPDLVIGTMIAVVVLLGARRILRLR